MSVRARLLGFYDKQFKGSHTPPEETRSDSIINLQLFWGTALHGVGEYCTLVV